MLRSLATILVILAALGLSLVATEGASAQNATCNPAVEQCG